MQLTGIPADRIVQSASPYNIKDVLSGGNIPVNNPENTVVLFAVSEKDMAEDPRFQSWTKKDGSQTYFQPFNGFKNTENMIQHGYILTVPTFDFTVLDQPMRSGTELRKMYENSDEKQRQLMIKELFGRYTREAEQIMNTKLVPAKEVTPAPLKNKVGLQPVKPPKPEPVSETGGTGVVASKAQAHDPRYSMSLTKDVRPGQINKSLRAFDLAEGAIDDLEARRIEDLNNLMDEIKQRITTEKLPANYVEALKQRMLKLKAERDSYYRVR
jgi:hypothetical protein